jgi:hypothetical protein
MAKGAKRAKKRGRKRVAWTNVHERELKTHSRKNTPGTKASEKSLSPKFPLGIKAIGYGRGSSVRAKISRGISVIRSGGGGVRARRK